jgi:hypothetical protein
MLTALISLLFKKSAALLHRYNAWDLTRMDVTTGGAVPLDVPLGELAVHYRGGAVIPMQPFANVTRDVRYAPVTLLVTLPAQPSAGSQAAATAQGPLPPHVLDEPCAAALARDAGQLVSCGLLYSDGDTLHVSQDNTVQVSWRFVCLQGLLFCLRMPAVPSCVGSTH